MTPARRDLVGPVARGEDPADPRVFQLFRDLEDVTIAQVNIEHGEVDGMGWRPRQASSTLA